MELNPAELQSELLGDGRVDIIEADMPDDYIYEGSATFLISVYNMRQCEEVVEDYESESDAVSVEDPEDTQDWVYRIHLDE